MRRILPVVLAVLAVSQSEVVAQASASDAAARAHAVHVLNRLAFGPRPGDVERMLDIGVDKWIAQQLQPSTQQQTYGSDIVDCAPWIARPGAQVEPRTVIDVPSSENANAMRMRIVVAGGGLSLVRPTANGPEQFLYAANRRMIGCRFIRAERTEQQLLEVMTDFWNNHFSILSTTLPMRSQLVAYDQEVIRPNALGRFRDLLGAVAHSPAMLTYLNNEISGPLDGQRSLAEYRSVRPAGSIARTGLNENYARELLELHTMGVDGGYTQADVIAVARALSGWSHTGWRYGCVETGTDPRSGCRVRNSSAAVTFMFDSTKHDAGVKQVLGRTLPAGRGLEDGEDVLDILAKHPATARFIARKLVVRFVSDVPPQALVDHAAETFLRTDGDIRAVMRTIVTSAEFTSDDVRGAKIKSPVELVLSVRRALAAPDDGEGHSIDAMIDMGQTPFGHNAPDGWPETGAAWLNTAAVIARINFAHDIAFGKVPSIPMEKWPEWRNLIDKPYTQQLDGVIATLLHGRASAELRAALLASEPAAPYDGAGPGAAREHALRHIVALVLGSPEFQRR